MFGNHQNVVFQVSADIAGVLFQSQDACFVQFCTYKGLSHELLEEIRNLNNNFYDSCEK